MVVIGQTDVRCNQLAEPKCYNLSYKMGNIKTKLIMKLFFQLSIVLIPLLSHGQQTKKVTKILDELNKEKEVYYVLSSDTAVRHGSYKQIKYKKNVLISGYYKMGAKDSLWTEYDWRGTKNGRCKIRCSGNYSKGKKVGIWKFYAENGDLVQEYDYDSQKIISSTEVKSEDESVIIINSDTIKIKLDTPVSFIGAYVMQKHYFSKNLIYPNSAIDKGLGGKVIVTFYVAENGVASGHFINDKIGNGFDEAAINAVKQIPNDWIPGTVNGKSVTVQVNITVNFEIMYQ